MRKLKNEYQTYLDQQQETLHGTPEWSYLEGRCDSYTVAIGMLDDSFPSVKTLLDK